MENLIRKEKLKLYIFHFIYFAIIVVSNIFLYYFMGLFALFPIFLVNLNFIYMFIRDYFNFKNIERFKCMIGKEIYRFNSRLFFTDIGIVSFNTPFFVQYEEISHVYKYLGFALNGNFISKLKIVSKSNKKYTINFFTPSLFSVRINDGEIKKIVMKIKKYNPNIGIKI